MSLAARRRNVMLAHALCWTVFVCIVKSWQRVTGTALRYRWRDAEWKEEPAEPISD